MVKIFGFYDLNDLVLCFFIYGVWLYFYINVGKYVVWIGGSGGGSLLVFNLVLLNLLVINLFLGGGMVFFWG